MDFALLVRKALESRKDGKPGEPGSHETSTPERSEGGLGERDLSENGVVRSTGEPEKGVRSKCGLEKGVRSKCDRSRGDQDGSGVCGDGECGVSSVSGCVCSCEDESSEGGQPGECGEPRKKDSSECGEPRKNDASEGGEPRENDASEGGEPSDHTGRSTTADAMVADAATRTTRITQIIHNESTIDTTIDPSEISQLPDKLATQCRLYIHQLLDSWQRSSYSQDLLVETKHALFPLLVKLRKNTLPHEMLVSISSILYHVQQREYQKASESYMKLSIGNVAWPIGVTGVGIHARSADAKITGSGKVSNIMIDDTTRLWITSVKRLVTFQETTHPRDNM